MTLSPFTLDEARNIATAVVRSAHVKHGLPSSAFDCDALERAVLEADTSRPNAEGRLAAKLDGLVNDMVNKHKR